MRVAAQLQDAGFQVVQSAYFGDPSTAKARELDVVAFRVWRSPHILWQLTLIVECKVSKRQPWVMFTRPLDTGDTEGQFQYYRVAASKLGRQLLAQLRRHTATKGQLPLLEFADRPAYGVQQISFGSTNSRNEDRRNIAFEAASKVAHAASLNAAANDTDEYADTPGGHIVLPVIAIDAGLFDAHLDATSLAVDERSQGVLDWNNPVAACNQHGYEL
jgi:hypothetical protein